MKSTRVRATGDNCHKINSTLVGAFAIPPDCASPLGLCSHGQIIGGGILNGTSQATLLSVAPSAGLGSFVPASTISVVEDSVITTAHGTLTLREIGIVDNANGDILASLMLWAEHNDLKELLAVCASQGSLLPPQSLRETFPERFAYPNVIGAAFSAGMNYAAGPGRSLG